MVEWSGIQASTRRHGSPSSLNGLRLLPRCRHSMDAARADFPRYGSSFALLIALVSCSPAVRTGRDCLRTRGLHRARVATQSELTRCDED